MDERIVGFGKTTEWVENQRPLLMEHVEKNVNTSITFFSKVEKVPTFLDLYKHVNENDANRILP